MERGRESRRVVCIGQLEVFFPLISSGNLRVPKKNMYTFSPQFTREKYPRFISCRTLYITTDRVHIFQQTMYSYKHLCTSKSEVNKIEIKTNILEVNSHSDCNENHLLIFATQTKSEIITMHKGNEIK